ncbi:U3 snoRNP protein [Cryptotrichosporon argae]
MATDSLPAIPAALEDLAGLIASRAHLLAGAGDAELAARALDATKALFDLGLTLEQVSHPHVQPFVLSILEPPAVSLRPSTLAKTRAGAGADADAPALPTPDEALPYTPLSELTTAGMEDEQVWAQLELRNRGFEGVLKAVGAESVAGGAAQDEEGEEVASEEADEEYEEDGSDEEMSVEDWERMMADQGYEEGDSASGSEDGDDASEDDDEEDDENEDVEMDGSDDLELGDGSEGSADVDGSDEDEDELDDADDQVDGSVSGLDHGASDDASAAGSDDAASASDASDGDGDGDAPSASAGPSRKRHPTLDDGFFSIDAFNRLTEEQEAGRVSGGGLGADDDDADDLGDLGALMLEEAGEDDGESGVATMPSSKDMGALLTPDIMYGDFFETPRGAPAKDAGRGKAKTGKGKAGKGEGEGKGKGKKGKGKKARFEDSEEDEPEEEDEDEDEARNVFGRVKGDLFDDDEDEQEEEVLSTHERRQRALAVQIAELEAAAVGPKDWQLLGEATARARPENSLLEENLDFEQVAKVIPVITEEKVQSLEDLIKQRIKDNNFDSTVRVRAYEPTPFLPSRYFELSDQQSAKSLAQIYEDEYQSAVAGGGARADPRDAKLKAEHDEIDRLWAEVCYKLDALSSLNFVPKQPKAQITTIDNVATTTLESALPPTAAASTMLAPEELFAPPSASALVARSEQTPDEAQAARAKARKARKAERQKLGGLAQLHGAKRKSVREEKEEALKGLVKAGKGVIVVGKGAKEDGKRRQREQEPQDAKRLKL